MSLALKKHLTPLCWVPRFPEPDSTESKLEIFVIFTSEKGTIGALRKAGALAAQLRGRITLVVPQVVPYPLPLSRPPVLLSFSEQKFRAIAAESPVETVVRLYLCRDRYTAVESALSPQSLAVLETAKRWWPTREKRLARRLQRAGHNVIATETESPISILRSFSRKLYAFFMALSVVLKVGA